MPDASASQRHILNRRPLVDPHIILLEFKEDGKSMVHRAAINTEDVEWRGESYVRAAIQVELPETRDGETRAQVVMSNIERIFSRAMNAAEQRINVRLILIDIGAPDVPLIDTMNLLVIPSASGSSTSITGQLAPRASLLEPVPHRQTTKADFPGVWLS